MDKWLWAARVFKTRGQAAEACRCGDVRIAGQEVKASRQVRPGDIITAKVGVVTKTVKALGLIEKRVGAEVAKQFVEDQTPASEYEKRRERIFLPIPFRPKGTGRPTKKERRAIEGLL